MKTYKNIFVQVVAFDNLMLAHYHASKGKKHRDEVLIFEQRKAEYCIILGNRLVKQTYKVGVVPDLLDPAACAAHGYGAALP